jgi:DNA polymerase I-like protein with 3'-5' exonuclease and polymerase domains
MKKALIILDKYATIWGIDYKFIGNIHDEIQAEVRADQSEDFGRLAVASIEAAGNHFGLRCPLSGEFKLGASWAETH